MDTTQRLDSNQPITTPPEHESLRTRLKGFEQTIKNAKESIPSLNELAQKIQQETEVYNLAFQERAKNALSKLTNAMTSGHPSLTPKGEKPDTPGKQGSDEPNRLDSSKEKDEFDEYRREVTSLFMPGNTNTKRLESIIQNKNPDEYFQRVILLQYIIKYLRQPTGHPLIKYLMQNRDLINTLVHEVAIGININDTLDPRHPLNDLIREIIGLQSSESGLAVIENFKLLDLVEILTDSLEVSTNPEYTSEENIRSLLSSKLNIAQVEGVSRFMIIYKRSPIISPEMQQALEYTLAAITQHFLTLSLTRINPKEEERAQQYLELFAEVSKLPPPAATLWAPTKVEINQRFGEYLSGRSSDRVQIVLRTDPTEFAIAAVDNKNIWDLFDENNKKEFSKMLFTRSDERDYKIIYLLNALWRKRGDTIENDMNELYVLRPKPPYDTFESVESLVDDLIYMYLNMDKFFSGLDTVKMEISVKLSEDVAKTLLKNFAISIGNQTPGYPRFEERVAIYHRTEHYRKLLQSATTEYRLQALKELQDENDTAVISRVAFEFQDTIQEMIPLIPRYLNQSVKLGMDFVKTLLLIKYAGISISADIISYDILQNLNNVLEAYAASVARPDLRNSNAFIQLVSEVFQDEELWGMISDEFKEIIYGELFIIIQSKDYVLIYRVFIILNQQVIDTGESFILEDFADYIDLKQEEIGTQQMAIVVRNLETLHRQRKQNLDINIDNDEINAVLTFIISFLRTGETARGRALTQARIDIKEELNAILQQQENIDTNDIKAQLPRLITELREGNSPRELKSLGQKDKGIGQDLNEFWNRSEANREKNTSRRNALDDTLLILQSHPTYDALASDEMQQVLEEVLTTFNNTVRWTRRQEKDAYEKSESIILFILSDINIFTGLPQGIRYKIFDSIYKELEVEGKRWEGRHGRMDPQQRKLLKHDHRILVKLLETITIEGKNRGRYRDIYPYIVEFFAQKTMPTEVESKKKIAPALNLILEMPYQGWFSNPVPRTGLYEFYDDVRQKHNQPREQWEHLEEINQLVTPPREPRENEDVRDINPINPEGLTIFEQYNLNAANVDTYINDLLVGNIAGNNFDDLIHFIDALQYAFTPPNEDQEFQQIVRHNLLRIIGGLTYRIIIGLDGDREQDKKNIMDASRVALFQIFKLLNREDRNFVLLFLSQILDRDHMPSSIEGLDLSLIVNLRALIPNFGSNNVNITHLMNQLASIPQQNVQNPRRGAADEPNPRGNEPPNQPPDAPPPPPLMPPIPPPGGGDPFGRYTIPIADDWIPAAYENENAILEQLGNIEAHFSRSMQPIRYTGPVEVYNYYSYLVNHFSRILRGVAENLMRHNYRDVTAQLQDLYNFFERFVTVLEGRENDLKNLTAEETRFIREYKKDNVRKIVYGNMSSELGFIPQNLIDIIKILKERFNFQEEIYDEWPSLFAELHNRMENLRLNNKSKDEPKPPIPSPPTPIPDNGTSKSGTPPKPYDPPIPFTPPSSSPNSPPNSKPTPTPPSPPPSPEELSPVVSDDLDNEVNDTDKFTLNAESTRFMEGIENTFGQVKNLLTKFLLVESLFLSSTIRSPLDTTQVLAMFITAYESLQRNIKNLLRNDISQVDVVVALEVMRQDIEHIINVVRVINAVEVNLTNAESTQRLRITILKEITDIKGILLNGARLLHLIDSSGTLKNVLTTLYNECTVKPKPNQNQPTLNPQVTPPSGKNSKTSKPIDAIDVPIVEDEEGNRLDNPIEQLILTGINNIVLTSGPTLIKDIGALNDYAGVIPEVIDIRQVTTMLSALQRFSTSKPNISICLDVIQKIRNEFDPRSNTQVLQYGYASKKVVSDLNEVFLRPLNDLAIKSLEGSQEDVLQKNPNIKAFLELTKDIPLI